MKSMTNGWLRHSLAVAAALLVAGFAAPVWAAFELPEGEKITNLPHIPRAIPQKEAYEIYDPKIGKNFDVKNFWMRADVRVRPEWRKNTCFGGNIAATGNCNTPSATANSIAGKPANDFYVQQWVRLGIGYDLSPDVNFYMEIIDSAVWGGNGNVANAGNAGDPLNHGCMNATNTPNANSGSGCRLGVRAAYMLVRNLGGVQGLSMKAGRQYVIFGNHSLFGHFDWANTGYSHDGIMFQYATKNFESHLGWFRNAESDLAQASPVGSGAPNLGAAGATGSSTTGSGDVDMFVFYNQIKSVPGFLIEPYYVLYSNKLGSAANAGQGLGSAKHSNQIRHMVGNRIEMRKGNWDFINELVYQFGEMGDAASGAVMQGNTENRNIRISAWATRNWLGYTHYQSAYKPRLAFNLDYASGDDKANCTLNAAAYGACTGKAGTFENFFPTNHIHMGYMDVQAWKNMFSPAINFQMRPSKNDHFEFWYSNFNLAEKGDNWYRGAQGVYVYSKANNQKKHIGDEYDITWTHLFADGKVTLQATYGLLQAGGYLKENMGGFVQNQHWGFLQLWMNF